MLSSSLRNPMDSMRIFPIPETGPGWRVFAILAVAVMLAAPALWNGYPLLYHDTEDYVITSFTWEPSIWRTMPYALIMALGRLFGSLWAVVAAQALLAAWVLHEAVCAFVPRRRVAALLALAAILTLFTSLPWVVSQLMPDALAGIVPLGLATLAFGSGLGRRRRAALAAGVVVAIAVHLSHVAVGAGLLIVLAALWALSRRWAGVPRPALGMVAVAVVAGILAVPAIHKTATGEAFFSRGGNVLQLALFVQNGVAKLYLDKVCPEGAELKLCPHRDKLPATADSFLWAKWASPFWDLGGWTGMKDEAGVIVRGALREFPLDVAAATLRGFREQLGILALGDGLGPKNRPNWAGEYHDVGKERYPQEYAAYMAARQQRDPGIDFAPINAVQTPIAFAAQGLLVVLTIWAFRRGDRAGAGLGVVMVLGLLGNAFVCGAISNPHDRYQNRVVWGAVAVSMLLALRRPVRRAEAWPAAEAVGDSRP